MKKFERLIKASTHDEIFFCRIMLRDVPDHFHDESVLISERDLYQALQAIVFHHQLRVLIVNGQVYAKCYQFRSYVLVFRIQYHIYYLNTQDVCKRYENMYLKYSKLM